MRRRDAADWAALLMVLLQTSQWSETVNTQQPTIDDEQTVDRRVKNFC